MTVFTTTNKVINRKIAWSNHGAIANISREGDAVTVHGYIQEQPLSFGLTEPVQIDTAPVHLHQEIVHISWSQSGTELAVVDAAGRITVYKTSIALNRLEGVGKFVPDQSDTSAAFVGLEWLCPNRPVRIPDQDTAM